MISEYRRTEIEYPGYGGLGHPYAPDPRGARGVAGPSVMVPHLSPIPHGLIQGRGVCPIVRGSAPMDLHREDVWRASDRDFSTRRRYCRDCWRVRNCFGINYSAYFVTDSLGLSRASKG